MVDTTGAKKPGDVTITSSDSIKDHFHGNHDLGAIKFTDEVLSQNVKDTAAKISKTNHEEVVQKHLDHLEDVIKKQEEKIAEYKEKKWPTTSLEKRLKELKKQFERDVNTSYKALNKDIEHHTNVIKHLEKFETAQGKVMDKAYTDARKALEKELKDAGEDKVLIKAAETKLEKLDNNHEKIREELTSFVSDKREGHETKLGELNEHLENLKKESAVAPSKGLSTAANAEAKSIGEVWKHSSGGMKFARVVGTGLGAGLTLAGAARIFSGPKKEEGKEEPSVAANVMVGGAQALAGLGLTYVSLTKGHGRGAA